MQKIITICFLFLFGCSPIQPKQETIIHPEWPKPIQPYSFDWKVVVIDNKTAIIGLDYDQSLEFRLFLEDYKRYTKESNEIICFYRKSLNDKRCN